MDYNQQAHCYTEDRQTDGTVGGATISVSKHGAIKTDRQTDRQREWRGRGAESDATLAQTDRQIDRRGGWHRSLQYGPKTLPRL